jgi:hypothetical protein
VSLAQLLELVADGVFVEPNEQWIRVELGAIDPLHEHIACGDQVFVRNKQVAVRAQERTRLEVIDLDAFDQRRRQHTNRVGKLARNRRTHDRIVGDDEHEHRVLRRHA